MPKKKSETSTNGPANGKAAKKTSKGGRRPKGGLGLRDDERQALHFRHVREFETSLTKKKDADGAHKKVKDKIKEEGGSIKAIELTLALRTEEGQQAFQSRMAEEVEVAKWNGVGVQLGLFGEKGADAIFEEGKRAAMQDQPAKAPSHLGAKAQQRWLAGHAEGRTALNTTRAGGFRSLGETVKDMVPPAVGDQPATHAAA
jgi:hypothetical protein